MMSEKLTLTDLQLLIRDSLYIALPEMYWVIAEISEIKENSSGHCYLELIEKHPDENNVRAKIKAIIWSNRYRFIKSLFENITGESIKEGLKVLVKAKIEYHEIYGLSLVITDIDPAFTVGELAMKRQQIIHRLEKEGVITMNKEIDFPYAPQRIAVISSKNAAGYTDFIKQLKGNSFGYTFYTALFDSAMQGSDLENDIINALNKIADNSEQFDLVVIIRGGGSQADLSWFDNYNIAYHITQFPLPVITGIGHDKDMSVTDLVAYKSLKTPTASAEFIIGCLSDAENHIYEMWQRIREISVQYTSGAGLVLTNHAARLTAAAKSYSQTKMYSIESLLTSLKNKTLNYTNLMNSKLNVLEVSLNILNPDNVLKRGYTITSHNGKIIKSKADLMEGDVIDTRFSNGTARSKVIR
ncbi:MAG: exodeoxyribonuclease VII large subunit [Bacteroidales bacterium]|nr:exodeoxyribonuclease VII large subunit [Bacteroidales bacterium]